MDWQDYVEFDERYLRPAEVDLLIGDPSKAIKKLGWQPSVTFKELVSLMVEADLNALNIYSDAQKIRKVSVEQAMVRKELTGLSI